MMEFVAKSVENDSECVIIDHFMVLIQQPIITRSANHIAYADGYEAMLDIIFGFNKTQYVLGKKKQKKNSLVGLMPGKH